MADEPENMTLRMFRSIDGKLDRIMQRMENLEGRMTAQEKQSETIILRLNGLQSELSEHGKRLDRIERRLDLVDAES